MAQPKPQQIKLTKARAGIVKKDGAVKGRPLKHSVAIESRYIAALTKLVRQMVAQTQRQLKADLAVVLSSDAPDDPDEKAAKKAKAEAEARKKAAVLAAAEKTKALAARFDSLFKHKANNLAQTMMGAVNKESAVNLAGSLKDLSGQMTFKMDFMTGDLGNAIKSSLAENVELITSIPEQYMARIKKTLKESAAKGGDMTGLYDKLEKDGDITHRRAKNIALDQTRKAYSTINGERMKAVGVTKFEWSHSGGGFRAREHHINPVSMGGLNGGIFSMTKPPIIDPDTGQRGLPAQLPNCKCTMIPVIDNDDEVAIEGEQDE
jgi:uncharacterized protein with gpF-like domain